MSEENTDSGWFSRWGKAFSKEPENRQELETLLEDAQAQDLIEPDSLSMIKGVLEVAESRVRDVMIPKVQVTFVDEQDSLEETLENMLESSHSRYPVFSEADEIVGVLLAKDVLKALARKQLNSLEDLKSLYRNPEMVSESKRLNVLLKDFKKSRNHMALVVDEYGEFAGLVTIEDVLEQIVGEIEDEHDEIESNIQKHVSGSFLVDAITSIDDFNRFFATNLEDEKIETVGGLALKKLGKIPLKEEQFELDSIHFTVFKSDARKVDQFLVTLTNQDEEDA
jgi:magnesium and cobalt transporter